MVCVKCLCGVYMYEVGYVFVGCVCVARIPWILTGTFKSTPSLKKHNECERNRTSIFYILF